MRQQELMRTICRGKYCLVCDRSRNGRRQAVDKSDYYIGHDGERSRIAAEAYEEMKLRHTYNERLKEVFAQL